MKECYSDGITLEETARRLHVHIEQYLDQIKERNGGLLYGEWYKN